MGFDIKPGMSCWNSMDKKYKKEYHIYAAKMERRKFENDRKLKQKRIEIIENKKLIGLSKKASIKEKTWFSWMEQ